MNTGSSILKLGWSEMLTYYGWCYAVFKTYRHPHVDSRPSQQSTACQCLYTRTGHGALWTA